MIKRSFCIVIGLCMLLTQAIAQTAGNSNFLSLNNSAAASVYYERHYQVSPTIQQAIIQERPGEKLRNTGVTLLVVGGVLLLGGIALVATSPVLSSSRSTAYSSPYNNTNISNDGFGLVLGVTAIGHGIAALIAGGVITGIGARKMNNSSAQPTDINE